MNNAFGLETFSKYEAATSPSMESEIASIIGSRPYSGDLADFLQVARSSHEITLVKTHDEPEDDARAIYIVRNGLVATDSYRHYRQVTENRPISWREIIEDPSIFGNWSNHLSAWLPVDRPNTLIVRYEDLLAEPHAQIARIGQFLGVPQRRLWQDPWARLHEKGPNFFRRGRADICDTVTDEEIAMFMDIHGEWMRKLGYASDANELIGRNMHKTLETQ